MTKIRDNKLESNEPLNLSFVPYTPSRNRNRILGLIGGLFVIGAIVNSYFLFKDESNVERAYYIPEFAYQVPANYEQILEKRGVVASKEVIKLTVDATKYDQIDVRVGDIVQTGDVLAYYNEAAHEQLVNQYENEMDAYKKELRSLGVALSQLNQEADNIPPSSKVNSNQINDFINVQVQMDIAQYHTSSEASVLLKSKTAEVERKLDIVQKQLDEVMKNRTLNSSVDGSIGNIKVENGYVTFDIHSITKNIITYVTEDEWRTIELDQPVQLTVDGYEETIDGFVSEKQELPSNDAGWLHALQLNASASNERLYEIRIDVNDSLALAPYGSNSFASITIHTDPNSFISPSHWIVKKEVDLVGDFHHYMIDYDGKIRLQPIQAIAKAPVEQWYASEDVASEVGETNEGETVDSEEMNEDDAVDGEEFDKAEFNNSASTLAEKQLQTVKDITIEAEINELTTFLANGEAYFVLIQKKQHEDYANAFTPLPLKRFSFDKIGTVTWKDVVKYLFY